MSRYILTAFDVKSLPEEMKTHTHNMNKIKTADKASISNTESKSTKIGLKETESNRSLPAVGIVIDHRVVIF